MCSLAAFQVVDLSSNLKGDRVMFKLWFSWLFLRQEPVQVDVDRGLKVNAEPKVDAS